MSDKRPTPFNLTICTEGVNHVMQYKSAPAATSAYRQLMELVSKKATTFYDVTDDFGGTVAVDCSHVKSVRLIDVAGEHRANMSLKLCELYAAHAFEEIVRTEHAALTVVKARNQGLIRAQ